MIDVEAQRTLVKSPPELWEMLSDPDSLAQQLVGFGEVRIVSSEPESTVAWEGEGVTGTVQLKASGWGTKVTITATRQPPEPPEPEPVLQPKTEPVLETEPEPAAEPPRRPGFFARLFGSRRRAAPGCEAAQPEPTPEQVPEPEPREPAQEQPELVAELRALEESLATETTAVLTAVLDKLGAAHHRPFSRA